MKDRIPTPGEEGRVKITPENGASFFARIAMADHPIEKGTDINKLNLLKDSTAALFGLDPSAVPDDVLSWIGGIGNLHHWYRRKYTYSYNLTAQYSHDIMGDATTADSIEIASTISVESGEVELVNPTIQTNPTKSTIPTTVASAAPCWVRFNSHYTSGGNVRYSSETYFFPEGTTGGTSTSDTITYRSSRLSLGSSSTVRAQEPTVITLIGAWEELTSMDRSAYPDSGLVNSYEYAYVGKIFDAPSSIARIAVGGYVGTGTYGIDNPTVINLEFVPKILILYTNARYLRTDSSSTHLSYVILTFGSSVNSMYWYDAIGRYCTLITNFDKTFSMHVEGSPLYPGAESAQYNYAGTTYNYIAIG